MVERDCDRDTLFAATRDAVAVAANCRPIARAAVGVAAAEVTTECPIWRVASAVAFPDAAAVLSRVRREVAVLVAEVACEMLRPICRMRLAAAAEPVVIVRSSDRCGVTVGVDVEEETMFRGRARVSVGVMDEETVRTRERSLVIMAEAVVVATNCRPMVRVAATAALVVREIALPICFVIPGVVVVATAALLPICRI